MTSQHLAVFHKANQGVGNFFAVKLKGTVPECNKIVQDMLVKHKQENPTFDLCQTITWETIKWVHKQAVQLSTVGRNHPHHQSLGRYNIKVRLGGSKQITYCEYGSS